MAFSRKRYRDPAAAFQLGCRIDRRARELGLSHATVARRAVLNYKTYMGYRRGTHTPDPTTLAKIATVLETTMEALTTNETAWHTDDPKVNKALHEIRLAVDHLSSDELELMADLALCAQSRHLERDSKIRLSAPAFHVQARIHERLLPVILGEYKPIEVITAYSPTVYGGGWLQINLRFRLYVDFEKAKSAMTSLIKNRLQLAEKDFNVRVTEGQPEARYPNKQELPGLTLLFRLHDPKAKNAT